jgi:hypothetical protein
MERFNKEIQSLGVASKPTLIDGKKKDRRYMS